MHLNGLWVHDVDLDYRAKLRGQIGETGNVVQWLARFEPRPLSNVVKLVKHAWYKNRTQFSIMSTKSQGISSQSMLNLSAYLNAHSPQSRSFLLLLRDFLAVLQGSKNDVKVDVQAAEGGLTQMVGGETPTSYARRRTHL